MSIEMQPQQEQSTIKLENNNNSNNIIIIIKMLQPLKNGRIVLKHVSSCKGSHRKFTLIAHCILQHRCERQIETLSLTAVFPLYQNNLIIFIDCKLVLILSCLCQI